MISNDTYYEYMCSFDELPLENYKEIIDRWYECFKYILTRTKAYPSKSIAHLFTRFQMSNWKDLHKENTEFSAHTIEELYEKFCRDTRYISDRPSLDRLFRVHWLFLQVFGNLYEDSDAGKYYVKKLKRIEKVNGL